MGDIEEFLEKLASKEPVPGGGSVAALEAAIGAALISMVCELTLGREKFASVQDEIQSIRVEATSMRETASRLVEADAEAFQTVSNAMKMARDTEEAKSRRREEMQLALKGAVTPPLETMRIAHAGMKLAQRLAPIGNPAALSDVGSGALSLYAAFHSARLNVEINLDLIRDESFLEGIRGEMPDASAVEQGRSEVMDAVMDTIHGST